MSVLLAGGPAWLFVKAVTLLFGVIAGTRLLPGPNRQVPGYRARPGRVTLKACAILTCGAAVTGCVIAVRPPHPAVASAPPLRHTSAQRAHYLGVFEPSEMTSWHQVSQFATVVGVSPQIVLSYRAWPARFDAVFAQEVSAHGAIPYFDWEPRGVPMRRIIAGRYDPYLRAFATSVHDYGRPVILSFAPEANGNWYPWGWTRTPPQTWVAAWRHVVTILRLGGATNVIWLWNVNRAGSSVGPPAAYWPGGGYVDWVGIDGYYIHRGDTFASVFGPTISAVRKLTGKPILLSETGIGQGAGQARSMPDLFAGIRHYGLLGLVWFDMAQSGGGAKQDWRLEGHPAAIAAFRKGVRSLTLSTSKKGLR